MLLKQTLVHWHIDKVGPGICLIAPSYSKKLGKNLWLTIKIKVEIYGLKTLSDLTEGYQLLIIGEAQRINEIGFVLKVLYDEMPQVKVIATGSSSFDLANMTTESLTGRKRVFHLLCVMRSQKWTKSITMTPVFVIA